MRFNDYQHNAVRTAIYGAGNKIIYPALGLGSEAGEVLGKVKKVLRDNNGEFTPELSAKIGEELADCLWYIAAIATDLGLSLEELAIANIKKLEDRKSRGVIQGSGDER